MKKVLIGLGVIAGLGLLVVGGGFAYATSARDATLAKTYAVHDHAVAVPFPLSEAELEELREQRRAELTEAGQPLVDEAGAEMDLLAGVDLDALAMERAVARGKHLVSSRYVCIECHGKDFSGGVMIDAPPMGAWHGPNLTGGEGSPTAGYTPADWDRIVRHGVRKDGTPAVMPSEDFAGMSDQELSDIVAYIGTFAPSDKQIPPRSFGPISTMLFATGQLVPAAEHFAANAEHLTHPPEAAETPEFGKHLAQVCTGCHRAGLNGGPILQGDPAWPPSSNLTTGEGGIGSTYSFEDFERAMREGTQPDGSTHLHPMDLVAPYTSNMTDTEMKALWAYLQSVPPLPTGT